MRKKFFSILLIFSMLLGSTVHYGFVSHATENDKKVDKTEESTTESTGTDNGTVDASLEKAREDAADAARKKQAAQEILDNLEQTKNNIEEYITQLDSSIGVIQEEIVRLEENQKELQESIDETQKQLEIAKSAQEGQYEAMQKRIQMVYESGNKCYLDVLLTATSMTDMINKTEYIAQVSLYDYNILKELKTAKEHVANLKQKLDKDLEVNEQLQKDVNEQKETMETLIVEKSAQVTKYEAYIAGQAEEVQKYTQAQQQAEAIIAAAELAASNSAAGDYTGGIFTWPVPGYNYITSYFGNRESPVAGASSNHKGIDIACDAGASVVAASSGTVIVADYNYAEGNYICIDHGGGVVTVYMHNSSLQVSVGEQVTEGQVIALAGSTGVSTGPHCHFGVRVNGTYVDPLAYLQ